MTSISHVMVTSFFPTRGCSRRPAAPGPFWQHPQHSGRVDGRQRSQRLEWWPWIPRPSEPLSPGKDRYTPGFKYTRTTSDVRDDCHYCSMCFLFLCAAADGCLENAPDTAEFSKEFQKHQHLFDPEHDYPALAKWVSQMLLCPERKSHFEHRELQVTCSVWPVIGVLNKITFS